MEQKKKGLTLRLVALEAALADVAKEYAKESSTQVSQHLLAMSKTFNDVGQFLAACKIEEDFLSTDAGKAEIQLVFNKENIKEIPSGNVPKSWSQAKSNIKRAWQAGVDPKGFDTESKLRKALIAKRADGKPANRISQSTDTLAKAIKMLPPEDQEKALDAVIQLTTKYYNIAKALVDDKKVVKAAKVTANHKADKQAIQAAVAQA